MAGVSVNFAKMADELKNSDLKNNFVMILGAGQFGLISLKFFIKVALYDDFNKKACEIANINPETISNINHLIVLDKALDTDKVERIVTEEINQERIKFEFFGDVSDFLNKYRSGISNDERYALNQKKSGSNKYQNSGVFIHFIKDDVLNSLEIFRSFYPKFIIPAIPVHYIAVLIKMIRDSFLKTINIIPSEINEAFTNTNRVHEYNQVYERLVNKIIPKEVLLSAKSVEIDDSSDLKIIFLSWAKKGETCPNNCIGSPNYCPHFKREKNKTITQIVSEIIRSLNNNQNTGVIFPIALESKQLYYGIGGIEGLPLKNTLYDYISGLLQNKINIKAIIFISTTCNCHGVINLI